MGRPSPLPQDSEGMLRRARERVPIHLDRLLLHRQDQQLGVVRSNQFDVPLVPALKGVLRLSP